MTESLSLRPAHFPKREVVADVDKRDLYVFGQFLYRALLSNLQINQLFPAQHVTFLPQWVGKSS